MASSQPLRRYVIRFCMRSITYCRRYASPAQVLHSAISCSQVSRPSSSCHSSGSCSLLLELAADAQAEPPLRCSSLQAVLAICTIKHAGKSAWSSTHDDGGALQAHHFRQSTCLQTFACFRTLRSEVSLVRTYKLLSMARIACRCCCIASPSPNTADLHRLLPCRMIVAHSFGGVMSHRPAIAGSSCTKRCFTICLIGDTSSRARLPGSPAFAP
jgi:hypothetical protein